MEAEAQAFSTLKTGIPPKPSGRSRNCPASISWPVIDPATALPKKQDCTSPTVWPASFIAALTASAVRSFRLRSGCLANFVMPAPAT